MSDSITILTNEIKRFIATPNSMRSLLILIISIVLAYWISYFAARMIIAVAQFTNSQIRKPSDDEKRIRLRRVETYFSVSIALVRALIVGIVAFYTWQMLSPGQAFLQPLSVQVHFLS